MEQRASRRFQLLAWPLAPMEDFHAPMEALPLREGVKKTKYPFRVLRYWWVYQGILAEARRLGRGPTIVDIGSEIGLLRSLAPPLPDAHWIGLDRNVANQYVVVAGFDELHECNLEQSIPLADDSADIIVCSHILEHLRNPHDTLGEVIRVLRPGGVLLVGSPVLPRPVAAYYQRRYNRELQAGKRHLGQHVTAFHPRMWKRLAAQLGLEVEVFAGSHILRWTGSRLENYQAWVRLNQFLAAIFPAFGNEVCIQLRVPSGEKTRAGACRVQGAEGLSGHEHPGR